MESLLQNYFKPSEPDYIPSHSIPKQKLSPQELYQLRINNLAKKNKNIVPNNTPVLLPPTQDQNAIPKKRRSKKEIQEQWTRDYKFVSIDPPSELPSGNLRYQVSFKYFDPNDKKTKKKTLRFGKRGVQYFIDHKNDVENRRFLNRQKAYYSPFSKNFWIVSLLCTELSIYKSYTRLLSNVL